jgi:uncharacterized protein (TIGR02594 family)
MMMNQLNISASVGIKGINKPNDIKEVQKALNKLLKLIQITKKLAVDGSLGSNPELSKTVAAIKAFQQKVMDFSRPDGRIDLNGKTHRTINQKLEAVPSSITASHKVPWMVTALKEVGQAEISGKKANPRILEYFKASKFWGTDDSGGKNAWCASFVAWVMKENGYAAVENAFRAKAWTSFGKKIKDPVYGAIGVKSRRGGGHVAFVVGQSNDGKHLFMLGGNQGDMVQIKKYPLSVWTTFVVPVNFNEADVDLSVYNKPAAMAGRED